MARRARPVRRLAPALPAQPHRRGQRRRPHEAAGHGPRGRRRHHRTGSSTSGPGSRSSTASSTADGRSGCWSRSSASRVDADDRQIGESPAHVRRLAGEAGHPRGEQRGVPLRAGSRSPAARSWSRRTRRRASRSRGSGWPRPSDYEAIVGAGAASVPRRGGWSRRRGGARSSASSARRSARRSADLGLLVTLETGKIRSEGEGEVQEMIDMCDFAVGLSRQLHGLTIASERPRHRMIEQWHPLGPVGIITAFNFPVAVWAWNAAVAAVCGDTMVWKPSPETPLTAIAVQHIVNRVAEANGCPGVFTLCVGGAELGERMAADRRLPLISATGSCRMGEPGRPRSVGRRLGRSLLELGGNNAADRHPERRPRPGPPRRRFRRRRHRRPALHDAPPADRPRVDRRRVPRPPGRGPTRSIRIGDPWEDGRPDGPADQRAGRRGDDGGARRRRGAGGRRSSTAGSGSTGRASSSSRRSSQADARRCRSWARRRSPRSST